MHVLLAGATGAVSRRIVPLLLARGHRVTGLTRRFERAEGLRVAGAHAAVVDVVEGPALAAVVRASAPDGILHQFTDLTGEDRSANARLRVVGTRNLVNAARAAGATRVVAHSIAFAYEGGSEGPANEGSARLWRPGGSSARRPRGLVPGHSGAGATPRWGRLGVTDRGPHSPGPLRSCHRGRRAAARHARNSRAGGSGRRAAGSGRATLRALLRPRHLVRRRRGVGAAGPRGRADRRRKRHELDPHR